MRRFVAQNKIWAVLVSALLLPVLLFAVSESELDDVAAMVTNAKKAPNTLFIIDTSESMNSFAYSDYIETCEDAQYNAQHAYEICQVSLKQCQDVKSEAGCVGGSIDCSSIQNNCNKLDQARVKLRNYCNNVKSVYEFPGYPNEDRRLTGSSRPSLKERFVGPWNPDAFYKDDICFYDWTSDTNGDVLNEATSEHWSNKSSDSNKWTTYEDPDTHDILVYKNTDRSDWDCITDGNDNMSNGQSFSALDGVSGFWLNWKYATSLDAVKILLANAHEFSYPPRSRGENKCLGYYYKPLKEENDTTACDSAEHTITDPSTGEVTCAEDPATGLPYYRKQKVCFISPATGNNTNFDTAYLDKSDEEREKFLKAWRQLVSESWKYTEIGELEKSKCAVYSTYNDFSLYDDKKSSGLEDYERGIAAHPDPVSAETAGCEKCMVFNGDSENPAFLETECKEFVNQDDSTILRSGELGEYKVTYHQECCKTSKCTNPKCRDNDLCCKNNAAAYPAPNPGEEPSEGYQQCVVAEQTCELGFYSEFDQDMTHCCDTIECVSGENGTAENELDPITGDPTGCKICKVGTSITKETVMQTTPVSGTAVLPSGYTYSSGINLKVLIDTMSGAENIEDMTVKLYTECNGVTPDAWSFLASFTCYREGDSSSAPCADYIGQAIMNPPLSGCETSGYKVKIVVSTTGRYCKMGDESFAVSLKYELPSGSFSGSEEWREVFDPSEEYFMNLRNESVGGANNPVVQEYECKTAFYHTQAYTDSSSCPRDQSGIVNKFHAKGYPDVRYCDPSSRRQETITKMNGCSMETTYVCTYLCRDELTYDEPWNCMAFFYQMDEMDRGGLEKCSNECMKESGIDPDTGENNTEKCCRCIDANYYRDPGWTREYDYFEPVDGVTMPVSEGSSQKKLYHCAVSGIMGDDTQVGWHAEIVNGHIREVDSDGDGVKDGTYLLTPYKVEGALFSPYEASHWLAAKSFITQKQGDMNMKDTTISAFKTASSAQSRENVCIYEVVENWGGDMCSVCSTCSFGCVDDPSISVKDDKCAYPSFWMKVPQSDGGELILSKEQLQTPESIRNFQNTIKKLKAVGGPTLGETLYDAWRFLGGMYAVYDPNHRRYNYDYKNKKWDVDHPTENQPYESPFSNQDPVCFSNEVVVLSGGQAQFDHNDKITQIPGASKPCDDADAPCVKHTPDAPSTHKPYYEKDWYQTSIEKVSTFVKTKPFYNTEVDACAKTTDLGKNIFGYTGTCASTASTVQGEGKNKPVINRIHSGAIGEWALSTLYNTTEFSYLEDITKKIANEEASEAGKYCSLTLSGGSGSCSFQNITEVLMNLLNNPQNTDVNSGRPHWTSSLVQPYDVEEKYRGPEAYVAGTVPIAPATSRFWFGNLKKYMVDDGDTNCNITISSEDNDAGCGGWKKQTFKSPADCFSKTDMGGDISDDEFKRLMAGGAARRLSDTLREGSKCSSLPCFKNVDKRKIYYDNGSSMKLLKSVSSGDFEELVDGFGGSVNAATAEQIFDYMYGYDAFATNVADRIKLRFGYDDSATGTPLKVLDPVNIDFNQSEDNKIEIRPLLLGAIVHSKPLAVYYGTNSSTRIYAGANDGMLHAFDELGNEKWAYIPTNALPSIAAFATSTSSLITFNSTVDGPITLLHIDQSHDGIINGDEKAYLIFGYRRGAQGYTVIDVTDPDDPQFVQNLNTDGGFSFGKAVVFRKCNETVCSYANQLDYYLAVPGGYDTCADGSSPACRMPEDASDDREPLKGNKFAIYKFNTSSGKFDTTPVFNYKRNPQGESDTHKKWLVASFASAPFAINTSGKGAVSTEFVYFTDLTGTVFRVDVRDSLPTEWSAKVVFAKRNTAGDMGGVELWSNGKSYVGNNFFPPLEKYNPGNDPERIPIPVTFGDASWPKVDTEKASMTVFYDIKPTGTDTDAPYGGYDSSKYETSNLDHQNQFYEDKSGWRIDFGLAEDARGEKGITDPMLVYDLYGSKVDAQSGKNGYSLAWNTYVPKKVTECKNFGTSFNYERLVIDGSQALSLTGITGNTAVGEWNPANCQNYTSSQGISIATAVGVVATNDGYDLTFGAGADIYRKKEISVLISKTRIIKWYELY
jgi:hypothetical protein